MRELTDILLVEDDPRDAKQIVRELNIASPRRVIDVVRDGEEALDFLFNRGAFADRPAVPPPGLVLLDLNLPKVDGLQVLKEIRAAESTRAIPVIILTSSREERDLVESYRIGINSYIQKPVGFDEFRDTVRTLGLYWMEINQPPPKRLFSQGKV
jgi:DNA-binding response OmpR family regulator